MAELGAFEAALANTFTDVYESPGGEIWVRYEDALAAIDLAEGMGHGCSAWRDSAPTSLGGSGGTRADLWGKDQAVWRGAIGKVGVDQVHEA